MYREDVTSIEIAIKDESENGKIHRKGFRLANVALHFDPISGRRQLMETAVIMAAELIKEHLDQRGLK